MTQSEGNTIMTFSSSKQIDYAYSVNKNVFQIELIDGRYVGAYSLRIPKPSGVTFDMVSNTDYYNSKKFGELDFVIEYKGKVLPIEVKSGKNYPRHSALSNVMEISNYSIEEAFSKSFLLLFNIPLLLIPII